MSRNTRKSPKVESTASQINSIVGVSRREHDDGGFKKKHGKSRRHPSKIKSIRKYWKNLKLRRKELKSRKSKFEVSEYQVMNRATQEQLQQILQNDDFLCDIPYDCTLEELKGEIAVAKGHATTIYIKRDGLSTLTIVLPQEKPTIANLKRGIEAQARIQLKREQRQRYEDRLRRRNESIAGNMKTANDDSKGSSKNCNADRDNDNKARAEEPEDAADEHKQVSALRAKSKNKILIRNAGELVYSEALSGQQHRPNVSWRFLWRAYGLLDVKTKLPLNDANGRTLLSDCGIENAATLKFCNRETYFGRKRQP